MLKNNILIFIVGALAATLVTLEIYKKSSGLQTSLNPTALHNARGTSRTRFQVKEVVKDKEFILQNNSNLKTLKNVCIVKKPNGKMIEIEPGNWAREKHIVVYGATSSKTTQLKVYGSESARISWMTEHTTKPVPPSFHMVSYPAFFLVPCFTGNFFHFIQDFTIGLFGAMVATNQLNSSKSSQVLIQQPATGRHDSLHRYKEIFEALGVRGDYNVYHGIPSGTCYPYGVFGAKGASKEKIASYITKKLDKVYPPKCPDDFVITMLQRKIRRILNAQELLAALKQNGFNNSQIITFENKSFEEQWRTIRCTNLLIGIQGAGLQWCMFLRPKSGMLELYYDKWPLWYIPRYTGFLGLQLDSLKAREIHYDWDYISKTYLKGKPFTEEMKRLALNHRTAARLHADIWSAEGFKWANAAYDTDDLVKKVKMLHKATDIQRT